MELSLAHLRRHDWTQRAGTPRANQKLLRMKGDVRWVVMTLIRASRIGLARALSVGDRFSSKPFDAGNYSFQALQLADERETRQLYL